MGYKIGSFNMYKFSFRADKEISKDIATIAEIINSEGFDIVALQEVLSPNTLTLLKNKLGSKWRYRWEQPKIGVGYSGSEQEAEGYAFLWNSETMELSWTDKMVSEGGVSRLEKHVAEPHIYNQYRIDRRRGEEELARNPYYGRFKPVHGFCEIRLINTHFYFGDNTALNKSKRKREFDILTKVIYHNISDRRYGNNLPAYTIILGDYNLNLNRPWTKGPYLQENVILDDAGIRKHIITVQDQLTTLKAVKKDESTAPSEAGFTLQEDAASMQPNRGYANNYDHFTYDADRFSGTRVKARRIDTVRKYEDDDFDKHRKEISDHVPVVLSLNLNQYSSDE